MVRGTPRTLLDHAVVFLHHPNKNINRVRNIFLRPFSIPLVDPISSNKLKTLTNMLCVYKFVSVTSMCPTIRLCRSLLADQRSMFGQSVQDVVNQLFNQHFGQQSISRSKRQKCLFLYMFPYFCFILM